MGIMREERLRSLHVWQIILRQYFIRLNNNNNFVEEFQLFFYGFSVVGEKKRVKEYVNRVWYFIKLIAYKFASFSFSYPPAIIHFCYDPVVRGREVESGALKSQRCFLGQINVCQKFSLFSTEFSHDYLAHRA